VFNNEQTTKKQLQTMEEIKIAYDKLQEDSSTLRDLCINYIVKTLEGKDEINFNSSSNLSVYHNGEFVYPITGLKRFLYNDFVIIEKNNNITNWHIDDLNAIELYNLANEVKNTIESDPKLHSKKFLESLHKNVHGNIKLIGAISMNHKYLSEKIDSMTCKEVLSEFKLNGIDDYSIIESGTMISFNANQFEPMLNGVEFYAIYLAGKFYLSPFIKVSNDATAFKDGDNIADYVLKIENGELKPA
jgi:hypothetical protein